MVNKKPTNRKRGGNLATRKRRSSKPVPKRVSLTSRSRNLIARTSPGGLSFLKTAFAPCDFGATTCSGVPDAYQGKTVTLQFQGQFSRATTPGEVTRIVAIPVPGYAYFSQSGETFTTDDQLTGTSFTGSQELFPFSAETENLAFTSFRCISQCIEIINTTNDFSWAGSITTFKIPLTFSSERNVGSTIRGLDAINSTQSTRNVYAFKDGAYSAALHLDPTWSFKEMRGGIDSLPKSGGDIKPFGSIEMSVDSTNISGIGNMESIVMLLDTGNVACTYQVRAWQTIEFLVDPASQFYRFAVTSPPYDAVAMKAYSALEASLPVSVKSKENAKFWNTIKSHVSEFTHAAARGLGGAVGGTIGGLL